MSTSSHPPKIPRVMLLTFGSFAAPDGGLAVRSVVVARCLAEMGVTVHVFSIGEADSSWSDGQTGKPGNRKNFGLSALVRVTALPSSPRFALGARTRRLLHSEARQCDAIVVESALLLPALWLTRVHRPIIWDTNELETLHYNRLPRSSSVLAKRVLWYVLERWSVKRATVVVAIGAPEALEWRRLFPSSVDKLMVADHAVLDETARNREARVRERKDVVFLGTLRAKHNLVAAEWIIEELEPQLKGSGARFVMVGRDTDHLTNSSQNVRLMGFVEDVSEVVAGASVCIAPLHSAAGVVTKILDYIHQGSRVIATPVAAVGFEDCPGVVIADLDEFPSVLRELLKTSEGTHEAVIRRAAQAEWYEEHCGQAHLVAQWRAILERVGVSLGDEGLPRPGR